MSVFYGHQTAHIPAKLRSLRFQVAIFTRLTSLSYTFLVFCILMFGSLNSDFGDFPFYSCMLLGKDSDWKRLLFLRLVFFFSIFLHMSTCNTVCFCCVYLDVYMYFHYVCVCECVKDRTMEKQEQLQLLDYEIVFLHFMSMLIIVQSQKII